MALLVLAINGTHTIFIYATPMISLISPMNKFVTCLNGMLFSEYASPPQNVVSGQF
jgi:hypothetical protein